jgi:hypothetical protein
VTSTRRFVLSLFTASATLLAQGPPPEGGPHGFGGPHGPGPGPGALGMGMGLGMHFGKVIAGEPYSADVTNTLVQTFADGNTINHVTKGHVARDSQGRTYLQQTISGGPWASGHPTTITFLSDPVAGYTYVLNPNTKKAMRRELKERTGERPPRPPAEEAPNGAKNRVETDLGQQTISGVAANGKSFVRTIPAGAIGNAQPIVDKSEIWTAPDLQIVVLSKRTDPRSGQATYELSNVQRAEPSAALFQVPSDYTVEDAPRPEFRR